MTVTRGSAYGSRVALTALQASRVGGRPPSPDLCPIALVDVAASLEPGRLGQALAAVALDNGGLQAVISDDEDAQQRSGDVPELYELKLPAGFARDDARQSFDFLSTQATHQFPRHRPMADVGFAVHGNHTLLMLRADQLISDLGAMQLFTTALSQAYEHESAGGSLSSSRADYFDVVSIEETWLASSEGRSEQDRWSTLLADADLPLLPVKAAADGALERQQRRSAQPVVGLRRPRA